MIYYRKDEIEDLAHSIGRHWGGQARDWSLVVEPTQRNATPTVELHIEIVLGGCTRISTVPLGKPARDSAPCATAPRHPPHDGAVAAVRRTSMQVLVAQVTGGDIEPLLGYLRCCGIRVLD